MGEFFELQNYIKNNYTTNSSLFELLNYELKGTIYQYGDHLKNNRENINYWNRYCNYLKQYLYFIITHKTKTFGNKKILSSSYFTYDKHLENLGYSLFRAPWSLKRGINITASLKLFLLTKNIGYKLYHSDFNYLISNEFIELINEFYILWKKLIIQYSFDALVVPNDVGFFERITIRIFNEIGKPTFNFAHGGMPSLYDGIMENRTDYVVMWGQKQVDAYIKMGYDPTKFFVSGHPFYNREPKSFRFSFENILVLNKNINGACPLEKNHIEDRSNAILYLYSIQNTLSKLGIKKARLRLHPSQNSKWYKKFINSDFYQIDNDDLQISLSKSSLAIGPISTTIIDAMADELNYLIYEPTIKGSTLMGYPITPPLDGIDPRIPIARTEENLLHILEKKITLDVSVYKEFAKTPFDISFIKNLI